MFDLTPEILDLQRACTDNSIPVSALLRKAQILALRLNDREHSDRFAKELEGYGDEDSLPTYRIVEVDVQFHSLQGWQSMTPSEVRPFVNKIDGDFCDELFHAGLRQSVSELETYIEKARADCNDLPGSQLDPRWASVFACIRYKDNPLLYKLYRDSPPISVRVVPLSSLIPT